MQEMTPEERNSVYRLRKLTKKNLSVCLMCLRYKNGNFHHALQFCSEPVEVKKLSLTQWIWNKLFKGNK